MSCTHHLWFGVFAWLVGRASVGGRWLEGAGGVGRWPAVSGMLSGQGAPTVLLLEDLRILKSCGGLERKSYVFESHGTSQMISGNT